MSEDTVEEYAVKIRKTALGTYYPTVLLDGEEIPAGLFLPPLGCMSRDGAVEFGRKIAEHHRENQQPPIPLNLGATQKRGEG